MISDKTSKQLSIDGVVKKKYFFKKGVKMLMRGLPKTYLSKPVVIDFYGTNTWAELAVLSKWSRLGYMGVWVDTFHKKLWTDKRRVFKANNLPSKIRDILEVNKKGCWDVIIWKGKEIKFIETKGIPSNDRIRETQAIFLQKMLLQGFKLSDFLIAEWDYRSEWVNFPG